LLAQRKVPGQRLIDHFSISNVVLIGILSDSLRKDAEMHAG
jgi:hypothetical protein